MNLYLRTGSTADARACGEICYKAFRHISGEHNFPLDFPNPESAIGLMNYIFSDAEGVYSVVAESLAVSFVIILNSMFVVCMHNSNNMSMPILTGFGQGFG